MSSIFSTLSPFRLFVKCAVPNVISMAFISFYYIVVRGILKRTCNYP
ncbi:TPA: hypothetical protein R6E04_000507 [Campylobacter jejuni]|nr:hypothetical protein [Campylobacter jejuni]EDO8178358.1 hypothetical protein [Campylobacter jejuni]EDO8663305.1 hypothetical protein [Campylobacter jejuni]EEP3838510.1 hypothetical protein [Campylobacter jejuni]EGA8628486.1 hypothetical protein [Campylobacter jejuni]